MGLLKYTLLCSAVMCLSVTADPLKQKPQSLIVPPTKNTQRLDDNELKPDFVPIYLYSRENSLDGDYNYRYETANGIYAEERGVVTNKGTENQANAVVGSYRYVSPEGIPIEMTYTAGVEGFRAYGAHLPVGPVAPSNIPKNLALKNVVTSAFARPAQLRTADHSADGIAQTTQAAADATPSGQPDVGQSQAAEIPAPGLTVTDPVPEVVLLSGDSGRPQSSEKQQERPAPPSNELEQQPPQQQNSFVPSPELYYYHQQLPQTLPPQTLPPLQQDLPSLVFPQPNAPVPQQPLLPPFEPFVSPKPAVAAAVRTAPPAFGQTQVLWNRQRPEWEKRTAVPAGYHQVQYVNARPNPYPAFIQYQQRPGPVRQFSVEPQQMWYVQPQGWPQQGRYFKLPSPVPRSLQPPKY